MRSAWKNQGGGRHELRGGDLTAYVQWDNPGFFVGVFRELDEPSLAYECCGGKLVDAKKRAEKLLRDALARGPRPARLSLVAPR